MPAIEIAEFPAPLNFIVSEPEGPFRARDAVKFGLNLSVLPGTVLGSVGTPATETATATADADNTGNGTLVMDAAAPIATQAKDGAYRVLFTSPTAFVVFDPAGREIGKGVAGTAFAKDVKFLVTAGATAFVANDAFTVQVLRRVQDELYVPLNPAATDGSQLAKAIAGYRVTTTTVPLSSTVFNGPGEVRGANLIWPAGITPAQQAEATVQLRALGIKIR